MKGLFITFEGPDGAGKSTQLKKLAEFLKEQHIPFIMTREPGGTEIGNAIRSILLDPANDVMTQKAEVLLYAASRAQHVQETIVPALKGGNIVLCDRFVDASIAYQGYGLELSVEEVMAINQFAVSGVEPDRTYLIDLPPTEGRQRMMKRQDPNVSYELDRIEQKHLTYHQRVREGFHRIYEENKQRICLIDGSRNIEEVFQDIVEDFQNVLQKIK
ncbi:thymidylate kinase [Pullulanibacillus camelliae]|uniref:Thymidylate kinase n=1 Tax=Pullulanibacillus camelliae TaxID=1707096 RepID=A0A8J2YME9_9BACL|nr:dTMP kinase [Pullulanibacillus camelliae]GGE53832.1 thymidylate kinase [Pullulanibacillus camelliae]